MRKRPDLRKESVPSLKKIIVRGVTPNFDFNLYGVAILSLCLLGLVITIPLSVTTSANLDRDDQGNEEASMPKGWWVSPVLVGFFTAALFAMIFPYKICELSRVSS